MARWKPFVRKDSYMPNNKMTPLVIGNGYTTDWGANGQPPVWDTAIGNPVSFNALTPFPLKQLQIAFSPVQDLHGYDAPWPAGGGANKLPPAKASDCSLFNGITATFGEDGSITLNGTQTGSTAYIRVALPTPLAAGNYSVSWFNDSPNNKIEFSLRGENYAETAWLWNVAKTANRTASGTAENAVYYWQLQINDGATFNNFKISLMVVVGSTPATSYAPYSNICPISGWDGVTVEQTSEILAELTSSASANGVTCTTNSDGSVTVKGTCTGNVTLDFFRNSSAFPTGISAGGKYVVSIENPVDAFDVLSYKGMSATTLVSFSNADHAEFTVPSDATGMLIRILAKQGVTYDTTLHVRICPYDGYRSISISFGSTVYSGTLDVLTGVGEINWVKDVYDGSSDEVWGYTITENPSAFYTQISHPMNNPQSMGNYLKRVTSFGAVSGFSYLIHSNQIRLSDMGGECADTTQAGAIAKLRAYLAANPFEVVHEIPTPIAIQLTPQEVESLAGDNAMWSNANQPITVEYRKN